MNASLSKMCLIGCWSLSCFTLTAQNLIPNPGFETTLMCPTAIGQFGGYVSNWTAANTASPDYGACGFTGTSLTRITPASGTAASGIWGATNHPNCLGNAYAENIIVPLTTTLVPGMNYTVSFQVMVDGTGSVSGAPNNCVSFGIYLYSSATPPTVNGMCCFSVTPQFSVTADQIAEGNYQTFSGTVNATAAWDRIQVGAFCNAATSTAACSDFNTRRMYFNVDNLSLTLQGALPHAEWNFSADAGPSFTQLNWNAPENHCTIWRSHNGDSFQNLAEWNGNPGVADWIDESNLAGESAYQISSERNGGMIYSEIIAVIREAKSPSAIWSDAQQGWIVEGLLPQAEYEIQMVDATGASVTLNYDFSGDDNIFISGNQIATGLYFLKLMDHAGNGLHLKLFRWE